MSITTENALNRAIRRVEGMRAESVRNQLLTYCQFVSASKVNSDADHRQSIGYTEAMELDTETLQRLFDEDDFGDAWSLMDSEHTEYYENDEGAIRAIDFVLAILHEEANNA